jgi:hypothetical protein
MLKQPKSMILICFFSQYLPNSKKKLILDKIFKQGAGFLGQNKIHSDLMSWQLVRVRIHVNIS